MEKVNYVLRGLIKGCIRAEKLLNSKQKLKYKYLLTEECIKAKVKFTEKFIKSKKEEYDRLQQNLEQYKKQYGEIIGFANPFAVIIA